MSDKDKPTICENCKYMLFDCSEYPMCDVPNVAVRCNYVFVKKGSFSIRCKDINPHGNCPHFKEKP